MTDRFAISPFGGKGMARAQFLVNEQVRRARKALDAGAGDAHASSESAVDKWQLLRAVTEARLVLGLSDRTIVVLEALASFNTERQLDPAGDLVVFPSNAELSLRARGMAPATLRRHLAVLVKVGLILRRDSANGKRYARRSEEGQIEEAFGFDLAPLVMRAAEIETHAAEARRLARAIRALRSEVTIHLRDIAAIIEAADDEGRGRSFAPYAERLAALSGRLGRNTDWETLKARRDALLALRNDVEKAYLEGLSEADLEAREAGHMVNENINMSANDTQNERHIHNSNPESQFETYQEKVEAGPMPPDLETKSAVESDHGTASGQRGGRRQPEAEGSGQKPPVGFDMVASACPQMRDYAPDGLSDWRDLMKAAETVRSMLGVSPDAWAEARAEMGDINAAITIAAMLERAEVIRSPGGYLRRLTERANSGAFSVKPMLNALISARQKAVLAEK
ncbi:replication initiation protein (plasmid) [Nitratireductor sp. L1-7-SE]|uniref:Replication initiation protein n=1 Tax=Nitratireductor rhodophyticola TaxID=2854036 RepID=A0ABS7RCH6_9HYPH|nr:plasmid replication protein RepC [Nitratireductor rhodophyticola]MBY8918617.1 replication initiation protein [Nitratireductor rhodophyticola]MBY8922960.1 replication initiation protein [Nitratireductor rhodophyticola]